MPGVRVIAAYEPRGVYALTAAVGLITGCIAAPLLMKRPFAPPGPSVGYDIACVFIPPAMLMLIFAMRCQRKRPVFLTGFLFTFCYWLSVITVMDLLSEQSGGAQLLSGIWVAFLIVSSAAGLIAGLAALALRWILRTFAFRLIEQTGRLCPRCAYAIDPATQPVCPECGSPTAIPDRTRTLVRAARAAGRPLLVVVLLGFLAIAAVVFARVGYPIYRFQTAIGDGDKTAPGTMFGSSGRLWFVTGAWVPFEAGSSQGVIASYLPDDRPGYPAMQLVASVRPSPSVYETSNPFIVCSLDRSQAEHAIRHGVPTELLAAIRAAGATAESGRRVDIDPAPYFPK